MLKGLLVKESLLIILLEDVMVQKPWYVRKPAHHYFRTSKKPSLKKPELHRNHIGTAFLQGVFSPTVELGSAMGCSSGLLHELLLPASS
jgi:hypothetical protein